MRQQTTTASNGILAAVVAGFAATLVMDAAMLVAGTTLGDAFDSQRLSPRVIGRWVGDLLRGRWRHNDISRERPRAGEAVLGVLTHYATGIVLTGVFLAIPRRGSTTLRQATAYGIATSALPLFVMFPSLGYGCAGRRSGEALRLTRIMLLGHTAFGLGIGIAANRLAGARDVRAVNRIGPRKDG